MKLHIGVAVIAAVVLAAGTASADYKAEYRAYMQAFNTGDVAGALAHGEAAWRAAEAELGDSETTAVLAYNYANLVTPYDSAKAIEAYGRALAITDKGIGALPRDEIELRLLSVRLRSALGDAAIAKQLRSKVDAARTGGAPASEGSARAYTALAVHYSRKGDRKNARAVADSAVRDMDSVGDYEKRLMGEALILGAIARVSDTRRDPEDVVTAAVSLDRAFTMFPPQKDIDAFDRLLGLAIAWRLGLSALMNSAGSAPQKQTGSRIAKGEDYRAAYEGVDKSANPGAWFRWADGHEARCSLEWGFKGPWGYSNEALNQESAGAAFIGFDVDDTRAIRTVVLGEVRDFGGYAEKWLNTWRLATPPADGCRRNHTLGVEYMILSSSPDK